MTDGTIISIIGEPALLEQTAEESIEFAHACQKLARKLRGENPTPVSIDECRRNVLSEWADVDVCVTELTEVPWWDENFVAGMEGYKADRWERRIDESRSKEAR